MSIAGDIAEEYYEEVEIPYREQKLKDCLIQKIYECADTTNVPLLIIEQLIDKAKYNHKTRTYEFE